MVGILYLLLDVFPPWLLDPWRPWYSLTFSSAARAGTSYCSGGAGPGEFSDHVLDCHINPNLALHLQLLGMFFTPVAAIAGVLVIRIAWRRLTARGEIDPAHQHWLPIGLVLIPALQIASFVALLLFAQWYVKQDWWFARLRSSPGIYPKIIVEMQIEGCGYAAAFNLRILLEFLGRLLFIL